jgi:hypothetical protein
MQSPMMLGREMKMPTSSSKSSRLQGPSVGTSASDALVCPNGLGKACPLTLIDDARPL